VADNSLLTAGLLVAIAATIMSAGLIVVLHPLLVRYALARPNARSSHKVPTPQGGGVAVIASVLLATGAAYALLGGKTLPLLEIATVFSATAMIAFVGAADDIRTIEVAPRLVLQCIAVGAVIAAIPADATVIPFLPWWVERAILLVAGIWFLNLVNFMDGIDWMTVAEILPVSAGLVILGFLGALPAYGTLAAFALFGAMLGFAPFNRPVARLFLGDVGSLPLGLLVGWLLLLVAARGHFAAALLLPLYYLADATATLIRRLIRGERVWQAHRTHFYQRATDNGHSVPAVVAGVLLLNVCLAVLAIITVITYSWPITIAALAAGTLLVGGFLFWLSQGTK
jgi:UDP-N-acetylmuramyl pentapeptide phosphotransferase/UDP-N-acetylglucosamine-1-phosphate transferase